MKNIFLASSAALLMAGGIDLAAPASAGCNTLAIGIFGNGQRCDGPVDQAGDFTRCDQGFGMGFGGSRCYVVKLGDPGQPPYVP